MARPQSELGRVVEVGGRQRRPTYADVEISALIDSY